jgi:actin-related protein
MNSLFDMTDSELLEWGYVIIDNGSFQIKSGMAGDLLPRSISYNKVCRRFPKVISVERESDYDIGNYGHEFQERINRISCYPMDNGIIKDWGDMKKVWNDTFYSVF